MTQKHFKTRTLGITVMESRVKGKVSSEVLDEVTQKKMVLWTRTGSLGSDLGSIFEVMARNSRDIWRWRSGAELGKKRR